MRAKATALLIFLVLALAQPGLVRAAEAPVHSGSSQASPAPWWSTCGGDLDRDGIQDLLETNAEQALRGSPDARVDLVVDLSRAPGAPDLGRLRSLGLDVQYSSHYSDAVLGSAPAAALGTIRSLPGVVMLEAQGVGQPVLASAGPSIGLDKVHKDLNLTGRGVTVAVLDTGVRATHISLDDLDDGQDTTDPKLVVFYDAYANQTTTAYDSGQHGTWTSSIAVGTGGGTPNIGGAPGAWLVGVRCGSENGFPESTALRGMEWVIDHKKEYNISVMSLSWGITLGGPNDHNGNSVISRTADSAVAAGINVVVAAGNTALSATVTAPGDAKNVVTVGSVNDNHHISSFSSEGPTTDGRTKPDVCAPGEGITAASSASDTGWYTGDGTSASAPLVGGLVACMLQADPALTPAQVKQILHETSEHNTALSTKYLLTPNNGYGWGVVDAVGAVLRAKDLRAPAMTLPATFTAGDDVPVEVKGTYTRTQHTDRGQDGRSPLGEDDIELTATVPGDWGRPSKTSYTMDGPIKGAVAVPDAVTQSGGAWRLHVTFRVRTGVSTPTTGIPTMKFSSTAPASVDGKTYNLTAREALNTMQGALLTEYLSVGGNVPPSISLIDPGAGTQYADASYTIRWTDEDPDNSAQITLAYDTDTDPGSGLVQIATGIPEDPDGEADAHVWDTSSLPDGGVYYVRATIDDGVNPPVSAYSAGPVTIKHSGNVPPTVTIIKPGASGDTADRTYLIEYSCYDPDDVATIDLYWDTDNSGFDGVVIVRGLTESDGTGDYTWDTSGQPDGAVRWVYATASDSANPPARTYSQGPVTIAHHPAPEVVDHSPDGTGVAVDEPVRVTFGSEMDRGSVEAALSVAPYRPGAFSWVGNTVRYDPQSGWAARTTYTVTVSTSARDSGGRPLAQAFTFTFTTGDAPPGPTSPSVTIISPREGDTVSGEVWVEGSAHDLGAGGVVDVRIDTGPWQQASGNEVWTYKWDSTQSPDGSHTVYARGTDAKGGTAPVATVNVTSDNAANRPPVIRPVPDQEVVAGELLEVQIEATDPDSDALRYSDSTPLFEIDPTTGLIAFRPYDGQVGTWHVTVSVTDGKATSYVTFNITVKAKEGTGLLSWPSWLGPIQVGILAAAAVVGVAAAVAWRRSAMARRRRAAAHKVKVASKGKHAKGEAT